MAASLTRGTACVLALLAATATAGAQNKRPMTFMDIMELKNVGGVSLSPDGSKVAYAVSGWEHPSAHRPRTPRSRTPRRATSTRCGRTSGWFPPPAARRARSRSARAVRTRHSGRPTDARSPSSPHAGHGTDAKTQIWILPMDGGEAYQLTTSKENVTGFEWSKDGSRIAFLAVDTLPKTDEAKTARRDDPQVFEDNFRLSHAWVIDVATKRATEVAHGNLTVSGAPSWSPDGTRLAFQAVPTTMLRDTRSDIYIVTIADKSMKKITMKPEAASPPAWSPDGKTIAFTMLPQSHTARADSIMDREIGNDHLVLYDVASGKAKDTYDPKVGRLRRESALDARRLARAVHDRRARVVRGVRVRRRGGQAESRCGKLLIGNPSLSTDGRLAAYTLGSPDAPAEVYVSDLTFASPKKLTDVNPQLRDHRVRRDGSDHLEEHGRDAGGRHPAQARRVSGRAKVSAARRGAWRPDRRHERRLQGELGIAGPGVGGTGLGGAVSQPARLDELRREVHAREHHGLGRRRLPRHHDRRG